MPETVTQQSTLGPDLRTIVIGYDGTAPAQRALEWAAKLAEAFQAKLVVTAVAPRHHSTLDPSPPHDPLILARGTGPVAPERLTPALGTPSTSPAEDPYEALLEQARSWLEPRGLVAVFAAPIGRPAQELVEVAEHHSADLIVVGTHEPGLLERLARGSVSADVAKRTQCSLLIVHPEHAA